MLKIVLAAAVAVSFATLDVADAATKKKKQKVRATAPVSYVAPAQPAHAGAALARTGRVLHR